MMGFGLADAVGSMLMGLLSDKFGRARVLALGFLLQGSVALTLVFWTPEKGHFAPPILMALILGLGDAAGQVVYAAICSAAFPADEVCAGKCSVTHFLLTILRCCDVKVDRSIGCVSGYSGARRLNHVFLQSSLDATVQSRLFCESL
jgi:hypothetical protein